MSLPATARALPSLFKVGFSEAVAYRAEFLVWMLSTTMPLIMLALWSAVAREGPVGRFGEKEFVAYFLATFIVRQLTGSWAAWQMNFEIRQGTLAMRLLRPIHPMITYAVENLAAQPLRQRDQPRRQRQIERAAGFACQPIPEAVVAAAVHHP